MRSFERQWDLLGDYAGRQKLYADRSTWKRNSYFHRLQSAVSDIERLIAVGDAVIVFDYDQWGLERDLGGRTVFPFLERGGEYWGMPENDTSATEEFERTRRASGASHFVVGWPAFRWTEDYSRFAGHLHDNFECVLATEQLVVFDLRRSAWQR
ncbi:MAG: hypothetical protein ABIO52_08070 [Gemmatimonadaceae bacterium]